MIIGGGPNRIGQGIEFDYCCVQHRTVLYIYVVAYANGVDIATQYCIEPNAASVAHNHIAYYSGIFSQITIFALKDIDKRIKPQNITSKQ
jgi:hypothetical protein